MLSKSILIIDVDRNLRHSIALILQRAGYRVETAGGASEAITYLKTGKYDLVIVEMLVPDDGTILLPRLLHLYPKLAFLVLTAQASPESSMETSHVGDHARLVKPVTPEVLLERVKSILHEPVWETGQDQSHRLVV